MECETVVVGGWKEEEEEAEVRQVETRDVNGENET